MIEVATAPLQTALTVPLRLLRMQRSAPMPCALHASVSADRGLVLTASDGLFEIETCIAPGPDLAIDEPGDVFLPPDFLPLLVKAKGFPRARIESDGRMLDIALPPYPAQIAASFALEPGTYALPSALAPGDGDLQRTTVAAVAALASVLAIFRRTAPRDLFAIVQTRGGFAHACDGMVYVKRATALPDLVVPLHGAQALLALAQTARIGPADAVQIWQTKTALRFRLGTTRLTMPRPTQQPVDVTIYQPSPLTLVHPALAIDRAVLRAALDRVRLAASLQALFLTAQNGTLTLRCGGRANTISEDLRVAFPSTEPASAVIDEGALRAVLDACAPSATVQLQFTRPRLRRPNPLVVDAADTVATIQQLRIDGGAR